MSTKPKSRTKSAATKRHGREAEAGILGAVAGAAMGAVAGPVGAAVGAVAGGAMGALAEKGLSENGIDNVARNDALDAEIGVTGGELGATNLKHPEAKRGVYSASSSGVTGSEDSAPAEGPIPPP
jgi:phage tail tape-measure protein